MRCRPMAAPYFPFTSFLTLYDSSFYRPARLLKRHIRCRNPAGLLRTCGDVLLFRMRESRLLISGMVHAHCSLTPLLFRQPGHSRAALSPHRSATSPVPSSPRHAPERNVALQQPRRMDTRVGTACAASEQAHCHAGDCTSLSYALASAVARLSLACRTDQGALAAQPLACSGPQHSPRPCNHVENGVPHAQAAQRASLREAARQAPRSRRLTARTTRARSPRPWAGPAARGRRSARRTARRPRPPRARRSSCSAAAPRSTAWRVRAAARRCPGRRASADPRACSGLAASPHSRTTRLQSCAPYRANTPARL